MNLRRKNKIDIFFDYFERFPREYGVFVFFGFFAFAILWSTFSYTVLSHDFYQKVADNQQIAEVQVPVTRGNIYAHSGGGDHNFTVLATSIALNDLAVDPQVEGDKEKLISYLTDLLYDETCYLVSDEECYNELLRFLRVIEIPDMRYESSFIKNLIENHLRKRISQDTLTSVLLRSDLTPEQETFFLSLGYKGVYISNDKLYINPEELEQVEGFAKVYQGMFGGNIEDIIFSIRKRKLRYISLFSKLSLEASDKIEQYKIEEQKALRQGVIDKKNSIGGFFILTPFPQRVYPEKEVASQIVGFLSNDGNGNYGIEGYYNTLLKGNPGELKNRKDINGRLIDPLSIGQERDTSGIQGADIYLTLDRNVQKKVEQILKEASIKYQANTATAVIMNPKTGKIISIANYPTFDSNNPGDVYALQMVNYNDFPNPEVDLLGRMVFVEDIAVGEKFFYNGREIYLREALREEYADPNIKKYIYKNSFGAGVYQNFAITNLYEPGSIMKGITFASGIDAGEIKPFDTYLDKGSVQIDTFTIRNVSKECLGTVSFAHALNFSCNVGMIRIVQRLGKTLFHKYLSDLGLDSKTNITLAGEVTATMPPPETWSSAKLFTNSYGLGITTTALQMATAYSVIANGGVYIPPYIVEKIRYNDGREVSQASTPQRRVFTQEVADTTRQALINSVEIGVAGNGKVDGYYVAGKTGTSQIAYRGSYEDGVGSTNASFVGIIPADNPQFVISVRFERPRTAPWGSATAAPTFAEIGKYLMEYYGIPKNR